MIVVDYFMENSVYYIVMEYIHGTTVKKYIQENGTMKGDEVLERMRPVLQAMEQLIQRDHPSGHQPQQSDDHERSQVKVD